MNTNDENRRWITFQGTPNTNPHDGRPRVTLDPRGRIRLNEKAYEIFGSPEAVELHYEPETATIGLTRHDPRAANAFPVQAPPNYPKYRYRLINVTPFCRFFDLTPERTMLFPTMRLDATGKMLLEIATAVPIGKPSARE